MTAKWRLRASPKRTRNMESIRRSRRPGRYESRQEARGKKDKNKENELAAIDVKVPDIGDFKDVPVIEVLVKAGDAVRKDDSLVTLESDKATMEVPSPTSRTVKDVRVKVGDKVSEGSSIITLEGEGAGPKTAAPAKAPSPAPAQAPAAPKPAPAAAKAATPTPTPAPQAAP